MSEREYHPAAQIFPRMTSDEFQELCDDIREHGQQLPIVLIDELILDGRNRYLDVAVDYGTSLKGENPDCR